MPRPQTIQIYLPAGDRAAIVRTIQRFRNIGDRNW